MSANPDLAQQLLAAVDRWMAAARANDISAVVGCYVPEEDISGLGTGPDEIGLTRDEIYDMFSRTMDGATDLTWTYDWFRAAQAGLIAWIFGDCTLSVTVNGSPITMVMRFTIIFVRRGDEWLIRHSHIATPDPRQAIGESWPKLDALAAEIGREHPQVMQQLAPDGTVTLLFSDIENSTGLTAELGDLRWIEVLREHNAIVRERVAAHGGTEVKTIGDAFMLAFPAARRALLCAIDLQRSFSAYNKENSAYQLRLRIGMHAGEPVREGGDFYGKSVILASRIAGEARGDEILVSVLLRDLTESAGDIEFEPAREVALKGFGEAQQVCPVRWRK
jgi:class 3 adenylate cyclase